MASLELYSRAAAERAMKTQEVILGAVAKKITWWQAAEIICISDRRMRRWRERHGLFCALYSDRGRHFWLTPKAGGKVDPHANQRPLFS
jgi:hypothetical protein